MAGSDFFRLDVQLHDVASGRHGRRVLQFAPARGESLQTSALKLVAGCSLAGARVSFSVRQSAQRPDVAHVDRHGQIQHWIALDPKDATSLRAGGRCAARVSAVFSSADSAATWWRKQGRKCAGVKALDVYAVSDHALDTLAAALHRRMRWHCTLDGDTVSVCAAGELIDIRRISIVSELADPYRHHAAAA